MRVRMLQLKAAWAEDAQRSKLCGLRVEVPPMQVPVWHRSHIWQPLG